MGGTKIEPANRRYPFVWKQGVEKHERKLGEKMGAYMEMAEAAWEGGKPGIGGLGYGGVGMQSGYTSADVKEPAAVLKERLKKLEMAGNREDKK